MKNIICCLLITGALFAGCQTQPEPQAPPQTTPVVAPETPSPASDTTGKAEIQHVVRQALMWADSKQGIDCIPAVLDKNDSMYIGMDMKIHRKNLQKLTKTRFFSQGFIENYNQIILTLDTNIKAKSYGDWLSGDLQPFGFANDVNPWCCCQETPDQDPSPWAHIVVTVIRLDQDKGELTWTWDVDNWRDIKYAFKVVKEDGRWKIDYMKGFDFEESTGPG